MLLGALAGDIIGSPYEHHNVKTKNFPLMSKRSRFTDDSVMTLAIAHALTKWRKGSNINESEFEKAIIKSMQKFGRRYPHAGYGDRFKRWLKDDSPEPYNSWGNGSAMRVSPVAWYFDNPLSHTRDFNHELDSLIKLLLLSFLFPRVRLLLSYAAIDLRKQALDQRYKSLLVTVWLSMRAKVPLCLGEAPAPVSVL